MAVFILLITLAIISGGYLAFTAPGLVFYVAGNSALLCFVAAKKITLPPAVYFLWPLALALLVSVAFRPNPFGLAMLAFYLMAIICVFISFRLEPEALQRALIWLAAASPVIWLASGWADNRNIQAVWPAVFALAAIYRRSVLAGIALGLLLYLGSRGAWIGFGAGLLVLIWPYLGRRWRWSITLASGALLVLLVLMRQDTAVNRMYYWGDALLAWEQSPFVGVGLGGLYIGQFIQEPGQAYFQPHAHNQLITWLATTGLVGIVALAASVYLFTVRHTQLVIARWQWAIFAALAAHGLVDDPLWWPGPLVLAGLLLGSIKYRSA